VRALPDPVPAMDSKEQHQANDSRDWESQLSLFQQVLLATDGTVTDLLRLYSGTDVKARKIAQHLATAHAVEGLPALLAADPSQRILVREIVLESSGIPLVHAASYFCFDRFSIKTQQGLLTTQTPIGSLWRAERLEMFREVIDRHVEQNATVARHLAVAADAPIVCRAYRIDHAGAPLGLITERFALQAFADR
jgi:chorismate-pyruvate lyase